MTHSKLIRFLSYYILFYLNPQWNPLYWKKDDEEDEEEEKVEEEKNKIKKRRKRKEKEKPLGCLIFQHIRKFTFYLIIL